MKFSQNMMNTAVALVTLAGATSVMAESFPAPLPVEQTGKSESLPQTYPSEWIFAHDANFFSILDGKVVLLDVSAESDQYKGMIGAGHMATFLQSRERNELYVAESFYTRRTRGERTDAIQIYDTTNLAYQAEIVLPGGKRAQTVTQKSGFQFTDGERLGLVFNFTPAASVTVVDFEQREVLSQIDTPGCSLIYPTGKRGFSMLCGDGGMTTFNLDEKGAVSKETRTEKFNEIEDDPLFMKTAIIDGVNYFVSFKGRVQPIDLQGEKARVLKGWSLLSEAEKKANWRPAGWHVINSDRQGRLYVLMQADGHEGSHKNGGGEVWVYDVKKKQRIRKLTLANHGISIEVTKGETPYLAVINANFEFDVYEADSGKHLRTIGGRTAETPFVMHAAQ